MLVSTQGTIPQKRTREFRVQPVYIDYVQPREEEIFASIDKSPAAHKNTAYLIPKENTVTQSVHLLVFLGPRYSSLRWAVRSFGFYQYSTLTSS